MMDLTKILEYQKIDGELFALEGKLNRSENKKKCLQLTNEAKNASSKSTILEERAGEALKELDEAKKLLAQNTKLSGALVKKDLDKETPEEIDTDLTYKDKILSNLNFLDRKITKIAENINAILAEYNETVKAYNIAKNKYKGYKEAYDKEVAEIEPQMKAIEKKLQDFKGTIDPSLLEKYNNLRKDKMFPVFVPLLPGNACGHCRMEVSASAVAKLDREGLLSCEHCRCLIYKK